MLEKSRGLNVDCLTYDLEDSVSPGRKLEARHNVRQFLHQSRPSGSKEIAVRINAVQTSFAEDDLTELVRFSSLKNSSLDFDNCSFTRLILTQSSFLK